MKSNMFPPRALASSMQPNTCAPGRPSYPYTVLLGVMDLRYAGQKDINYSLANEFKKRGFNVKVVGNRQILEATRLPQLYRSLASVFTSNSPRELEVGVKPDQSPGRPPRTIHEAAEYAFSRLRIDKMISYDLFEKIFSKIKPDLFITEWYFPEMLKAAKKIGATTLLWCLDDPMIFEENWFYGKWFEYASMFDHVFTFSKGATSKYREKGISRVDWLPLFYDPTIIGPTESGKDKPYPLSFVGNRFRDREPACRRILMPLVESLRGSMHIFGSGWTGDPQISSATLHGSIPRTSLGQVFSDSMISLNLHREPSYRFIGSLNYRTFEIAGAGCFQLIEYIRGVEDVFRLGTEIVVARSGEEAVELVRYYLEKSDERERIAERAKRRAAADHTVAQRIDKILEAAKLKGEAYSVETAPPDKPYPNRA